MRIVMTVQTKDSLLPRFIVIDGRAEGAVALGAGLAMAGAGGTRRPFAVRASEDRRTVSVGRMCLWMMHRGVDDVRHGSDGG